MTKLITWEQSIVEASERLAAAITAQLYNVWEACPQGQTFDEFLNGYQEYWGDPEVEEILDQ